MSTKRNKDELTTEELRKYEGFENYTDEECEAYLTQLKQLSFMFYRIYQQKNFRLKTNDLKTKSENL